jgi:hypothetical protein
MTRSFSLVSILVLACCVLAACQNTARRADPVAAAAVDPRGWFDGEYDNHEQVWQAKPAELPRVHFAFSPMKQDGWYLWRTQWSADTKLSMTWLLHVGNAADGSVVLTPYRPLVADPALDKGFDVRQWNALDACVLHGSASAGRLVAKADAAACATVAPGVGVEAALLPLSIERDGEWLRVRLYADQARGADARADARRVRWFGGWAAVNGAGQNATADSGDWHMNRTVRVGSEGGRVALNWRDGKPSGYSLELERVTYREGNTPVLKLSVIEDASGRSLVYAWANPEATRIGLNLGWVQIGLELETMTTGSAKK